MPSPASGVIKEVLFNEGDVVPVGAVFAIIGAEGEETSTASSPAPKTEASEVSTEVEKELLAPVTAGSNGNGSSIPKTSDGGKFYSPLVRSIAETEGVTLSELEAISGTGQEGRVTKKDILAYLDNRGAAPAVNVQVAKPVEEKVDAKPKTAGPAGDGVATQIHKAPPVPIGPNDEIIEMDRMRKMIADHMVMSTHVSPHVTSFVEADVTNIVLWREKNKKSFLEKTGEKLTFTPIFIEAVVKALQDYPMVNTMLNGKEIVVKKDINVGMATALPTGNLIVPVIHNADQYNMVGLAKKVNSLAGAARENKLSPDDIQGGTYTVSNVGTFGNVMGTPIINQPQSAILALGAIRKKPAVIETPFGDTIGIRHQMFLSHSYDHRIIDGALGGSFVKRVAEYLEAFDIDRAI